MPVRVVDAFEPVEIHHDDAYGPRLALAAGQFSVENLEDRRSIPNASKEILRCLFAERFTRRQKLRLQLADASSGAQARLQLVLVERLGYIIVGTGLHALDQILFFTL